MTFSRAEGHRAARTGSFEIRYPGGFCYNAATEKTEEFYKLVEEADKTFKTVKEYIDLMDKAPELSARDFNMPYKLLAEFNGVVLGGIEHPSSRSFEFTTWSFGNNALYHGHYFTDYEKAKEDFVVRSGLLQFAKLFNDKEMMQIYRCTEETLNNGYELSDEERMFFFWTAIPLKQCLQPSVSVWPEEHRAILQQL